MAIEELDVGISDLREAACPLCGTSFEARRWLVLDLDRRPALRTHAVDGSLQRSYCPRCIGPGVDLGGAFLIVRRAGPALQVANFAPFDTPDIAGTFEALHRRLREHLASAGAADTGIEPIGSRLFSEPGDIDEFIEDCWPDLTSSYFDPEMLAGPLRELLAARLAADLATVLLAHPDLARPNMESFLGHLAGQKEQAMSPVAWWARSFIDRARRDGIDAALQAEAAALAATQADLAKLTPELDARLRRNLDAEPGSALALESHAADSRQLAADLLAAGAGAHAGDVLARLAMLHRRQLGPRRASHVEQAIAAYADAVELTPPAEEDTRWQRLMGLSACWDERVEGERAENVEQALACADEAVALAAHLPRERLAEASMELGVLYTRRSNGDPASNLSLARSALERAVALAKGSGFALLARHNLALTYVEDDLDRSGRSLDLGIAQLRVLAQPSVADQFDPAQQQNLMQSLAVALAKRADLHPPERRSAPLGEAAAFAQRAHALATSRGDVVEAARLASLRASIEADGLRAGGEGEALPAILDLLDEAAEVFTPATAPYEYARNEIRRAGVLRDLLDPVIGEPLAVQALERAARVMTPEAYPDIARRVQATLAGLHMRAQNWGAGAAAYGLACEASERLLAWTETPLRREDEVEPNALLYAGLIDALLEHGHAGNGDDGAGDAAWRVLEAMERGRARLYLDMMGLRPLPALPGLARDAIEREARLIARLAWTLPTPDAARDAAIAPQRLADLRATRQALESLWDEMAASGEDGQRHVAMRRIRPPDRRALQAQADALGERVACLSFFVLERCIVGVWLQAGGAPVVRLSDLARAGLPEQVLASFERDVLSDHPPSNPPHDWLAFGERLFGPFAERLAALDLLVLVPHAQLHGLPLHALTVAGRPLIAQVAVSYAPSLAVLASVRAASHPQAGRGTPLVASHAADAGDRAEFETETRRVAALNRAVMRPQVRRSTLRAVAPTAPLIHLACHGHFDAVDPLQSGVVLADAVMSARDWLALRLRCDLVTLSACETGQQLAGHGDELLGLARALLQAGSASVLLSLWRIYSDTTVEWMAHFYTRLADPQAMPWARAAAFRSATLALRARDGDPCAWAAFMLAGDPG